MERIINYNMFEQIIENELVIVIAKTKTCAVCKPLSNKLTEFMKDYPEVLLYEVYLEDVEIFQGQHLVFTVPTILVFSNKKELLRESRFIDFDRLSRLLEVFLNSKTQ